MTWSIMFNLENWNSVQKASQCLTWIQQACMSYPEDSIPQNKQEVKTAAENKADS